MSIIVKPNTFSPGQTIIASQHNSNFDTIYADYNGGITNLNLSASAGIVGSKLASLASVASAAGLIPPANLNLAGLSTDVYNTAWTDYSGTSTIIGWSSLSSKLIYYKTIGKLVFVNFYIEGTSNATTVSFTVPYISTPAATAGALGLAYDNGSAISTATKYSLASSSSAVSCYTNMTNTGAWTNVNLKVVEGEFFYQAV